MNIKIESNCLFSVSAIHYSATGELCITLNSDNTSPEGRYQYTASLGSGQAEEKPTISLLQYAKAFAASANVKYKTKDSYRLMCGHLEKYGDIPIDKVTTPYLQDFILNLQSEGLKAGTVRLYFQKLACVLHDAYKNGLFDDRILQRVKRPKREQEKKSFLLQQKTDTHERLPLCGEAEALLRGVKRGGEFVFRKETNQRVNVVLKRWCKEAKIRKTVSFHSARHTFMPYL